MAYDSISGVKIIGMCCCVPDDCRRIADIDNIPEAELNQFIKTTGIKQAFRSAALNTTTSDLCFSAAENLFKVLSIERDSIDVIIFVSQSPDYIQPATACVLQYRLGLSNDCAAFDISLGCSGYIYGLHMAALYLQRENIRKVLLLTGESIATHKGVIVDKEPALWGDAGSATILKKDSDAGPTRFLLKTDGSGFRFLGIKSCSFRHGFDEKVEFIMSGADVFAFTLREVPKAFKEFYAYFNVEQDDYDIVILHQANRMIIESITKKLKIPREKAPISIDLYGNTSSASIPLGICDYFNRQNTNVNNANNEIKILASGFGVGLSWGIAGFNIDGRVCLPVITTDKCWDDGII